MRVPSGHRAQGIPAKIVVPPVDPREYTEEGSQVYVENCRIMLEQRRSEAE
jgi:hypothetical protein